MAITYTFKGGKDLYGYGYFAYIEDGQLVIGEHWPREGGVTYRGTYRDAGKALTDLKKNAESLYNHIIKYYEEKLKEDLQFDEATKTILFKVKLHMDDGHTIHSVLVRGRFQADVIKKLFPPVPEVLTLQTYNANVFAVRSEKISAAEFVED